MANKVLLLRPGAVTAEQIRALGIETEIAEAVEAPVKEGETVLSPGMKYKHYAPKARVVIVDGTIDVFSSYVPVSYTHLDVYKRQPQLLTKLQSN